MLENPLILSIETATRSGSVCLTRGDNVLAGISHQPHTSHSTHLIQTIDDVLKAAEVRLDEVDLFAAAAGPGSFTGLRIGLATVKAFAATLDRGCLGIPTLQAVAHAAGPSERTVALLPAGRGELFAQLFVVGPDGSARSIDQATHLRPAEVWDKYGSLRTLRWAGEGALLHAPALSQWAQPFGIPFYEDSTTEGLARAGDGWIIAAPCENLAASVSAIALSEFHRGNLGRAEDLSAIYVRPSDAEINQKWHNEKLRSR